MEQSMYLLSAGLEFFFAAISVILLIGCLFDHDRKRPVNRLMIALLAVHALMNAIDACIWIWCDIPQLLTLVKVLTVLSYSLGCTIFALFSFVVIAYISEYRPVAVWVKRYIIGLGAFMTLMWVISLFNGMYYYWDESGILHNGRLYWFSQVLGMVFLISDILLVLAYRSVLKKKERMVLLLYCMIPLLSYAATLYWAITPLYMASTISLLLYYTIIHVEHGQRVAAQATKLVQQELELANSRTAIMLSQIKPHFLYNSLTAIAQLCEKKPQKAKEATLQFSAYLRQNMNSITQNAPIPFTLELEHVRTYLSIEKIRFGDYLNISYDIGSVNFRIPPLSLQPIVENAVKHGVGMKEDGGTVTIRTRECPAHYEITVSDDGVGFDAGRDFGSDPAHIGIRNVRARLEAMMAAALFIESRIGYGTNVTIRIPKEGKQ